MAGTILENLSGKKLAVLVTVILLCQISCFLIGGLVAPAPSNAEMVLGTKCLRDTSISKDFFTSKTWQIPRGKNGLPQHCEVIENINDENVVNNPEATADKIVFAHQFPLPKYGQHLDYSRWMQNLITVLQLDVEYQDHNIMADKPTLTLMVKVGYRNKWDEPDHWTMLANALTERTMDCTIEEDKKHDGYMYNCDVLSLFELGSLHHDYYLINIGIPVVDNKGKSINNGIGYVKDIFIVAINQNGGFTKVWVSLKTCFFPIIIATMIWYWNRIKLLARPPMLLERMLLALGATMTLLNLPVEFLTLWIDMPFTLILSDVRQGIFYASLLSFWLVFCGEHLMDDVDRNKLRSYWKHLSAVAIGCFCLFLFDVCERGVQLFNPFYSLWTFDAGTKLALAFIIIAGASACIYFFFLCYMVYRVFRNISFKRSALPSMSSTRRMFYEGIIYRFKFLMMATLVCAALTVIAFIMGQASEGRWKWEDNLKLQYTSAFFTGVYGMWNCYIFTLLCMYAPSHKHYPPLADLTASSQEEVEFSCLTASDQPAASEITEVSSLTEFAKKQSID